MAPKPQPQGNLGMFDLTVNPFEDAVVLTSTETWSDKTAFEALSSKNDGPILGVNDKPLQDPSNKSRVIQVKMKRKKRFWW